MVQDINALFRLVRLGAFGVATFFGFIVFALGASITNYTASRTNGGYFTFAAFAIATGILTIVSLPPIIWVSMNRKTAITSMVVVELIWTWFLWVLWLACAGNTASTPWLGHCNWFIGKTKSVCSQTQAITALSFLAWITLLVYNIFLFFIVVRQHQRGNTGVWTGYILDTDYAAPGSNGGGKAVEAGVQQPVQYTQPQYSQAQPQLQVAPQQPYIPAAQPS